MPADILDRTWTASPEAVPVARHSVIGYLRASETPDPPLNDIGLAVSEAVSNVVTHAYVGCEPGPVRVRVETDVTEIRVVVEDAGRGMVPRTDSPGLGLGMPVIATVAERIDVCASGDGGTRVCMWFRRDPGTTKLPG